MLAFPPLDNAAFARFDECLSELASQLEPSQGLILFRVVQDLSSAWREFRRPIAADAWTGEHALIGPFEDEAGALRWADRQRDEPRRTFDVIPYAGVWLCDVFELGDPDEIGSRT